MLVSGNVTEAERLAEKRGRLIEMLHGYNPKPGTVDCLREKLLNLQSLQESLISEAKKLHSKITEDLKRIKEDRRLSGYGGSFRRGKPQSKFITKIG